jgi:hypothetical protein
MGAAAGSSAAGSHPAAGSSEKSLPGPATSQPTTALTQRLDTEGSHVRKGRS